jgi:hypothetical protein
MTSSTSKCRRQQRPPTGDSDRQQQQQAHPRRASRAADGAGHRVVLENRPGVCWRWPAVSPTAEPAQSRDAVAAAAGLVVQADDLSRRAEQRLAAQHAGRRRADHLSADRRRHPIHARPRLLVAAQLRRRLLRHDDDRPRARAFEEPGDGALCSTAASPRAGARASTQSASSRSRRASIRSASVLSVRARRPACAAVDLAASTPRSPTRATARRRM